MFSLIIFYLVLIQCDAHEAITAASSSMVIDWSRNSMKQWLCEDSQWCVSDFDKEPLPNLIKKILSKLHVYAARSLVEPTALHALLHRDHIGQQFLKKFSADLRAGNGVEALRQSANLSYPYFAVLPMPVADVIPDKGASTFQSKCYSNVEITAIWSGASEITVTIVTSGQKSFLCTDIYLIVSGDGSHVELVDAEGTKSINMTLSNLTVNKRWYINTMGLHVFIEPLSLTDAISSLIDTVTLLEGFGEDPITPATLQANIDFFSNYVQYSTRMQPKIAARSAGSRVIQQLNTSLIQSGDAFLVRRLDGLDPMIGWGEGSSVGHSTIAMRDALGRLFVCESTTNDSYWVTNGVQCNAWETWSKLVVGAQQDIVYVPLSAAARKQFNVTAAMQFFNAHKGLDYGYSTFLFGWIDTRTKNFPCVPPDFTTCLTPESALLVAFLIDDLLGSRHDNIFRQALNHRIGVWPQDLILMDTLHYAWTIHNKSFVDLYQMPEQDSWVYNTTKNGVSAVGRSMVCCVFVCSMWKAGGLFSSIGNDIQCGEQTLWDIASMNIFDARAMGAGRPKACIDADPQNPLCQLNGNYTLFLLPDLNSRALYHKMGESCSSLSPNYVREKGC